MICNKCGKEIADDSAFCTFCGASVVKDQQLTCKQCGRPLEEGDQFCPSCGASVAAQSAQQAEPQQPAGAGQQGPYVGQYGPQAGQYPYPQQPVQNPADAPSGGFFALGFFFPVIGLILYLVWKDSMPLRSKSAGKGALIGVIVWFVLGIVMGIIGGIAGAALGSQYMAAGALVAL